MHDSINNISRLKLSTESFSCSLNNSFWTALNIPSNQDSTGDETSLKRSMIHHYSKSVGFQKTYWLIRMQAWGLTPTWQIARYPTSRHLLRHSTCGRLSCKHRRCSEQLLAHAWSTCAKGVNNSMTHQCNFTEISNTNVHLKLGD